MNKIKIESEKDMKFQRNTVRLKVERKVIGFIVTHEFLKN